MKAYITRKIEILKDMKIWKKLDKTQKAKLENCETKFEADCITTTYINRYL